MAEASFLAMGASMVPASGVGILDILKELHEGGRTVILITHDNGIAEQAKRIVRIMDGKIESDTAKE